MNVKAVFFDLDGTLVDTMPDIIAAIDSALRRNGFPCHPQERYPSFVGHGLRNAGMQALPPEAAKDAALVERMYRDILDAYRRSPVAGTRAYEGIEDLVRTLRAQGYRLVIITNKDLEIAEVVVRNTLPHGLFDFVVGVNGTTPPKPDPAGTRSAMAALGLGDGELVFVGDSDVDIRTAKAVGCSCVAVSWGYRPAELLKEAGAVAVARNPGEILSILEERDET